MLTLLRHNLRPALIGTFSAMFFCPGPASAKLGEDLPALTKRFGTNYHPISLGRWAEAAYEFETKNLTVDVFLVKGVSVSECYFSDHALVNGTPSQSIWRAIREKNAPNAKWIVNGDHGFVSTDNRYTTWFDTKGIPAQFTYSVGINDQIALRGDVPVPPLPSSAPVAEQADYATRHDAVMSGMRQWGKTATREQGRASAVKAHATGDVEPLINTYRAMGLSEEYIKGFREGVRLNETGSTR